MRAATCLLMATLALTGCAGTDEADEAAQRAPLRFAVIAGPQVGVAGERLPLSAEDLLLEVVTQLSAETDLAFCLVPGPLVSSAAPVTAAEGLAGALGSLAIPVHVALAPTDQPAAELLAVFADLLPDHPGRAAYAGDEVRGLRPVVLGADGASPKLSATDLAVQGGAAPPRAALLVVSQGEAVALTPGELRLPPLAQPPHLFGIATLEGDTLSLELRSAVGEEPPAAPPAVRVSRAAGR